MNKNKTHFVQDLDQLHIKKLLNTNAQRLFIRQIFFASEDWTFLNKIQNRIDEKTGMKILLLYGKISR